MHPIEAANYQINANGFYYMDTYHPYRSGENPNWNAFSGKVLDLKNGKQIGIDHFHDLLLQKKLYDGDYAIVTVPPSDPAKFATHGTNLLVNTLFERCIIKKIINGHDFLVRHTKVTKSVSGNRSIEKHLGSIHINDKKQVNGKTVLLIDDVTTTGNSLTACAQILTEAGCKKVISLALAQTA